MRVWDQACDHAKNGEWVNLHVSRALFHFLLIHCDVGIVFFIDVKVFKNALAKEILEIL